MIDGSTGAVGPGGTTDPVSHLGRVCCAGALSPPVSHFGRAFSAGGRPWVAVLAYCAPVVPDTSARFAPSRSGLPVNHMDAASAGLPVRLRYSPSLLLIIRSWSRLLPRNSFSLISRPSIARDH